MKDAIYALLALLALIAVSTVCAQFVVGRVLLALLMPYLAFAIFTAGISWRVVRWAWTPVPFRIPLTCGQQKSLPWIKPARIDNPFALLGVLARMASEIVLFRSLFRNSDAHLRNGRLSFGENKVLWLGAIAFHFSLLLIVLRHVRLVTEHVARFVNVLERLDGFFQISAPHVYLSDVIILCALLYLLVRRFTNPYARYISLFSDYFALLLLIGIAVTGILLRYFTRADVPAVKQFVLSLVAFRPIWPAAPGSVFLMHLTLVCTLLAWLPFSKLMHAGGVFLSPTRNLANNSRSHRHINPWNAPVQTHSYAEWEKEFGDKLRAAGIPLEGDHA